MQQEISGEDKMQMFGDAIGERLHGGETIELIGDIGVGKTTLTKGIALGLGVDEVVQSPSFTISRVYSGRDSLELHHYDFYRLESAGIMSNEICESVDDKKVVTVVEWGEIVNGVLPLDRLTIKIVALSEDSRELSIMSGGKNSEDLLKRIRDDITARY